MAAFKASFLCTLALFLVSLLRPTIAYKNVYGNDLKSCSSSGMALTGYTRTGYCVDQNDDAGSHHICIDLSSTQGGNFCSVTGQSDWCSSTMECHDTSASCQVQEWCVCQWAFASYLENAGGCSQIQDIVCEAINMEAVLAYQSRSSYDLKIRNALECIAERCGVPDIVTGSSILLPLLAVVAAAATLGVIVKINNS